MYKQLLAITFSALILTACGGSDSSSTNTGNTNSNNNGSNTGSNNNGESNTGPVVTGESGNFGDAGTSANSVPGTYTLCPANTQSFSIFAEVNGNFCVPGCPAGAENPDNDEFGSVLADNGVSRYSCFITTNAPGSQIQLNSFSAPISGCPAPNGCPEGSFPRVYITATAGADNLAGTYTCADWSFDVNAQDWGDALATPAPFTLTLNADQSANINGADTTWTFANGVLTLEGNRTFTNVAVGNGSFTEYRSNTYITRCKP